MGPTDGARGSNWREGALVPVGVEENVGRKDSGQGQDENEIYLRKDGSKEHHLG